MKALGIILIVIGSMAVAGGLSSGITADDIAPLIMTLSMIAGGVLLIRKSNSRKKEVAIMKQYHSMIVDGNVRRLDAIAYTTGKSYDEVYKDVKKMINKGYLKNAYIDESSREVVLPTTPAAHRNTTHTNTKSSASARTQVVVCPSCGANNTIVGNTGECEYCGSPLK